MLYGKTCMLHGVMELARCVVGVETTVDVPLLSSIDPSNEHQIRRGIDAVLSQRKKRVGVVGLAFKAGTDDLRESPMVRLVETLIGKGCALRIFDKNVNLAALVGANRVYIEKEIPHISSLMCDDLQALIDHSEVLVIGSSGEDAKRALAMAHADQTIVDLTRGAVPAARMIIPADEFSAAEISA